MIKNEHGHCMNRNGRYVPPKTIPLHLKRRDETVTKIMAIVDKENERMKKSKAAIFQLVNNYIDFLKKRVGDTEKSTEGNLTLSDYANLNQVDISISNNISFDENLNIAKSLIDKCLKKWSAKSNVALKAVIQEAFNIDKKGRVNSNMILRLLALHIEDKDFLAAQKLIKDSIQSTGTRQYTNFKRRSNQKVDFKAVQLNFSVVEV